MSRFRHLNEKQIADAFRMLDLEEKLTENYTNADEFTRNLVQSMRCETGTESIKNTSNDVEPSEL